MSMAKRVLLNIYIFPFEMLLFSIIPLYTLKNYLQPELFLPFHFFLFMPFKANTSGAAEEKTVYEYIKWY